MNKAFIDAVEKGNAKKVLTHLNKGVNIEAICPQKNMRALDVACEFGHIDIATFLLDRGSRVNAHNNLGWTPILHAAEGGHLELVKLLHTRGANIHHANEDGRTALHWAAWEDFLPVCKFLLSEGADLMAADNEGESARSRYGEAFELRTYDEIPASIKSQKCEDLLVAHVAALRATIEAQRLEILRIKRVRIDTAAPHREPTEGAVRMPTQPHTRAAHASADPAPVVAAPHRGSVCAHRGAHPRDGAPVRPGGA